MTDAAVAELGAPAASLAAASALPEVLQQVTDTLAEPGNADVVTIVNKMDDIETVCVCHQRLAF
jgi:hypothetical protein